MNKDIRLATSYFDHPKYRKLRKRLGAKGALSHIQLLTYVGRVMPRGILEDMDAEDIAEAAGWRGDPNEFVNCLLELRLLDRGSKWYGIHNWAEWNSYAMKAESRSRIARENANKRWQQRHKKALKEIERSQEDNAIGIANGNAVGNAPSPSPSPPPPPPPSLEGGGGGGEVATPHVEDDGDPPPADFSRDNLVDLAEEVSSKHFYPDVQDDLDKLLDSGKKPKDIHFALLDLLNRISIQTDARTYFKQKLAERANSGDDWS